MVDVGTTGSDRPSLDSVDQHYLELVLASRNTNPRVEGRYTSKRYRSVCMYVVSGHCCIYENHARCCSIDIMLRTALVLRTAL